MAASALAGAAGCGADGAAEEPAGATSSDAADSVAIADFGFAPEEIAVPVGATVTFENRDSAAHTATADDSSFDTKELSRGEAAEATFDEPGTYSYYCRFHVFMKGSVVVG